jgi:hypothetical protein
MASARKRTWTSGGKEKAVWIADYFDQAGVRRQKTFTSRGAAKEWLPQTQQEVKERRHIPDSKAPTVREAAEKWVRRGEGRQPRALHHSAAP